MGFFQNTGIEREVNCRKLAAAIYHTYMTHHDTLRKISNTISTTGGGQRAAYAFMLENGWEFGYSHPENIIRPFSNYFDFTIGRENFSRLMVEKACELPSYDMVPLTEYGTRVVSLKSFEQFKDMNSDMINEYEIIDGAALKKEANGVVDTLNELLITKALMVEGSTIYFTRNIDIYGGNTHSKRIIKISAEKDITEAKIELAEVNMDLLDMVDDSFIKNIPSDDSFFMKCADIILNGIHQKDVSVSVPKTWPYDYDYDSIKNNGQPVIFK